MRSRRDLLNPYAILFWPQPRVISLFGISHVCSELRPDRYHASSTGPAHACRGELIIRCRNPSDGPLQLSAISHAIQAYALEHQSAKTFKFIQASLLPPKKVDVLNYLGIIPTATLIAGPLLRRADVDVGALGYT